MRILPGSAEIDYSDAWNLSCDRCALWHRGTKYKDARMRIIQCEFEDNLPRQYDGYAHTGKHIQMEQ